MRTVLITGASGFIGRHLVSSCRERGWHVIGLDRNPARTGSGCQAHEHFVHPVTSGEPLPAALAGRRIDATALLAWPIDPVTYLDSPDNLGAMVATLAIASALLAGGCRTLVATGTCAEYAKPTGDMQIADTHPLLPTTLYAACKVAVHTVLAQLCRSQGAVCTWARLFNTFGPGEPATRLLPSLVCTLAGGGTFPTGSGVQVRDYLHVQDIATALVCCLEGGLPGAVNICSGRGVRLADLMACAAAVVEGVERVQLGARSDRAWDPPYLVGDPGRLVGAGWLPHDPLALIPDYARSLLAACRSTAV